MIICVARYAVIATKTGQSISEFTNVGTGINTGTDTVDSSIRKAVKLTW